MTTTGLDLLGTGPSITLADGTTVQLTYSFRSLALLEARFRSIKAVQDAIDTSGDGPVFGNLLQIVGAGCVGAGFEPLIRERQQADGTRVVTDITYRRRTDGADLADLMTPSRVQEYSAAMSSALSAALASPGNDPAPVETLPTDSPGTSASDLPVVPSTFLPMPSGA